MQTWRKKWIYWTTMISPRKFKLSAELVHNLAIRAVLIVATARTRGGGTSDRGRTSTRRRKYNSITSSRATTTTITARNLISGPCRRQAHRPEDHAPIVGPVRPFPPQPPPDQVINLQVCRITCHRYPDRVYRHTILRRRMRSR